MTCCSKKSEKQHDREAITDVQAIRQTPRASATQLKSEKNGRDKERRGRRNQEKVNYRESTMALPHAAHACRDASPAGACSPVAARSAAASPATACSLVAPRSPTASPAAVCSSVAAPAAACSSVTARSPATACSTAAVAWVRVEEISEVDCAFADIKCIDEVELSEEQRRQYRKVREEDDAKIIKRMQCHMKRRRARGRHEDFGLASSSNGCYEKPPSNDFTNGLISSELKTDENKVGTETLKRTREDDDELDEKRLKTVIIESDDDMQIGSKSDMHKDGEGSSAGVDKEVDIIDLDLFSSQSPKPSEKNLSKAFKCTICTNKLNASDVHRHPVLDVTVCGSCRILYLVVIAFGVHKVNNFKVVVLALSGLESSDPESSNTEFSGPENNDPVRQDHLKSMQEQSASKITTGNIGTSFGGISYFTLEDAGDGHIVNLAREEDEEPVRIPSSMSSKLKTHQVEGIRFMWENVIQSVKKVRSGDKGLGCILAHNMGLGKTFQVITFLYTVMRCAQLELRTALVVTPVNVLYNWRKEFTKWCPEELKPLRVYMLEDVTRVNRPTLLTKWRKRGGVLLIGYSTFRNLSLGKHVKDRNAANEISYALQFGPDILVCDEAHMIKNRRADITQALKQVATQRRIALTGSPLQNNLMEYYCMVDFVREGFLGSSHEFRNRFQNPIENGQHTNSTSDDVKIMNQRSHILFEQLKGFVQRMGMNVVKNDLPPKKVFVITVKLSQLQRKLYRRFLDVHRDYSEKLHNSFFAKYQILAQVWNHPGLLQMAKEQRGNLRKEDAVENFLMDDSSSDDNAENLHNGEKLKDRTDQQSKKSNFVNEESNWWEDLLDENTYREADYSGKLILLLAILSKCSELGDKVLVFSQSLTTLDLVEFFLSKLQVKGKEGKFWKQGKDWYRLDGSTPSSDRQNLVERFNDPENTRVKCTLISTRAGSLGINLHAANRVVLLDGSWNPTHDLQAIYRTKPVYAYRLMAHGTMEEKIYKRQVTKEGLAARVVDRQQVSRTISREEMLHLFEFGDEELLEQNENDSTMIECVKFDTVKPNTIDSTEVEPVDKLMLNLLSEHNRWIAGYHEHEALLQENEEDRLTKEEQELALSEWEALRKAACNPERRSNVTAVPTDSNLVQPPKVAPRSRQQQQTRANSNNQKKCNNLTHLLTLRSNGTKAGCTTTCKECGQEISWETLNRDGRAR
ncbi:hypothetical protein PR202_ga00411 [Eleusine coracana subsp. coracana]|uniref:Transcriptional regulator ATRX n=1 Tax=Eleusine coracana subsp. coracana TaxID=191504 RepID=A0AAV5BHD7_ELECO|nr:hypothetical protein PR202_ga00411 [Eleusine coracana subsp. coracana]